MKVIIIMLCLITMLGVTIFLIMFNYGYHTNCSSLYRTTAGINAINEAIAEFKKNTGILPKTLQELEGPYLIKLELDPWGNNFQYDPTQDINRRIFSKGADGETGGEGAAADIYLNTDFSKRSIYKC